VKYREASNGSRSPRGHTVVLAGLSIGMAAARRLIALGYDVWGVTHNTSQPGWYVTGLRRFRSPHPTQAFDGWLEAMHELARSVPGRPSLLAMSEHHVLAIDRGADQLRGDFLTLGLGSGLRTSLTAKRSTFELADQHDFPRPAWRYVEQRSELAEFVASQSGPVLIKPDISTDWKTGPAADIAARRKVISGSAEHVLEEYDRIAQYAPNVVAQEVIPGPDDHLIYWCGVVGSDGRVGGRLVGRKRRVSPIHYGTATFVQLIDRPDVEEICEQFLRTIGYRGPCGIELKHDPRDGVPKLIEVNPRYSLWDDIGIPVGVDLAHETVRAQLGYPTVPARPKSFDQKWVDLGRDAAVAKYYRREHLITWPEWIRSLAPPIRVNDVPLGEDPRYVFHLTRKRIMKVVRRARSGQPMTSSNPA
jgi:D-aspartate ligase